MTAPRRAVVIAARRASPPAHAVRWSTCRRARETPESACADLSVLVSMDSSGVLGRCPDNLLLLAYDRQRAVRLARKPTAISHHPRHAGPPSGQAHPPPWTVCGQLRMTVRCPTSSASQKDRVESPPVPCASRTVRRHPLCHACDRPVGTSFDVRTYLPAQESVVPLRAVSGAARIPWVGSVWLPSRARRATVPARRACVGP